MSSADEILQMNTLHGTNIVTSSAARTLIIINCGEIILYLDCSLGTGLLTLHTADASIGTGLTGNSTLVVAGALNDNSGGIVNDVDNVVGTGLGTEAAADTFLGIDFSDALLGIDGNGISGTNRHTVTVAEAGIGAKTVARIIEVCRHAGLDTVVSKLSVLGLAGSVAGYVSNLLNNVASSKAHNLTDLLGNTVTTGSTEARVVGLALGESSCIAVTAGEAAGTAVCAGKTITNCRRTLVNGNCKEGCGKSKDYCTYQSDNRKKN